MKYITKTQNKARKILAGLLALCAGFAIGTAALRAGAERVTTTAYIICQPGDYVNARRDASRASASIGRMEAGDAVEVTGKVRNGYAQCRRLMLEEDDGWIHSGYIVFDRPVWKGETMTVVSRGRVACRKYIGGAVRCWVNNGNTVQVFWWTSEWCVTNRGFIRTEYLTDGGGGT